MINPLPKLKHEVQLGSFGFYEYRRCLKCPIGGISDSKILSTGQFPVELPNKKLIIGIVFHSLMDFAKKCVDKKALISYAANLIEHAENQYSDYIRISKSGSIKSWSEVTNSIRAAMEVINNTRSFESGTIENEVKSLKSPDGKFSGVPDMLIITGDEANLTEYKSTDIYMDGLINPEHVEQIKFYSFLIYQCYPDVKTVKYTLKSLSGNSYSGVNTRHEISEYKIILENNYNVISSALKSKETKFNLDNCINCNKSVVCKEYILNTNNYSSTKEIFIINGELNEIRSVNNSIQLKIDNNQIDMPAGEIEIVNLSVGAEYLFYRLGKTGTKYIWGFNSGVYRI